MVDKAENVEVEHVDIAFYLQNVLFAHLVAARIFDDRNGAVELIELQMVIDGHCHACLNMVEYKAFFNFTYV